VRRLLTFVGAVTLVSLALGVAGASATQGGSAPFVFTWDVSAGTCPQLAGVSEVTFNGVARWNFDGTGAVHTAVTGTAADNLGNSYVFNYRNNYKGDINAFPFLHMTDHFNLVGSGGSISVHASFVLNFVNGSVTFKERGGSQTAGCDPF
jgi:hypothetical protein